MYTKKKLMHTILISGFGKMGMAHCKSFILSNKKYEIFLHDKKFDFQNINFKKILKSGNCKFYLVKKIPKLKFDLAIISTNSKARYKIAAEIIKNKLTNFLLLEKFLFNKEVEYKKIISSKKKIFLSVNTWGEHIFDNLKLKKYFSKYPIQINYFVPPGTLLTNLVHILDFFTAITRSYKFSMKYNNTKIIKSKRKGYDEIVGNISFYNKKGIINISTNHKKKYHFATLNTKIKNFFLKINHEGKCIFYNNKRIINEIDFPFSSKVTEIKYLNKKKKINADKFKPNFNKISKISILILKLLNVRKKKLSIT